MVFAILCSSGQLAFFRSPSIKCAVPSTPCWSPPGTFSLRPTFTLGLLLFHSLIHKRRIEMQSHNPEKKKQLICQPQILTELSLLSIKFLLYKTEMDILYLFIAPSVGYIAVNKTKSLLSWTWHSWGRVGDRRAVN